MKKMIACSVFAALLVTLTGCSYGHGPLKDLRSGKADEDAAKAAKAAKTEQKAVKAEPKPAAKAEPKAVKAEPAAKKSASAQTAPAK